MSISSTASPDHLRAPARGVSAQAYAKAAGVLLLISMICGGIGEAYVPSRLIVSTDAAATAHNIAASQTLFRLGFLSYLVEAVCDICLALVFYVLLKPAGRNLARLTVLFALVSTTLYAVGEIFYFAPSLILSGADYLKAFSTEQVNALSLLSFRMFGRVTGIFMLFYGVTTVLRGYLIMRSGYLPAALGVLLALAGVGFIAQNIATVMVPTFASTLLLVPTFLAVLALMLWLLVKGVDVPKWEARVLTGATTL